MLVFCSVTISEEKLGVGPLVVHLFEEYAEYEVDEKLVGAEEVLLALMVEDSSSDR